MDKIWDRKSFKADGHWPVVAGIKKLMTTQNRQKSNTKKKLINPIELLNLLLRLVQVKWKL